MFLDGITKRAAAPESDRFPWTLPVFRDLDGLAFRAPVSFLVGDDGSGKSTLLEGLAMGMSAIAAGRQDLQRDDAPDAARRLADELVMRRSRHSRSRHFMRAKDVFGLIVRIKRENEDPETAASSRAQLIAL